MAITIKNRTQNKKPTGRLAAGAFPEEDLPVLREERPVFLLLFFLAATEQ
jgi:hypothetical protein